MIMCIYYLLQSSEKVLQWEESKRWQKKVDALKTKLADSGRETEALQRQVKSLKDVLERFTTMYLTSMITLTTSYHLRSDREKGYLHKKLQSVQKNPPTRLKTATPGGNDVSVNMQQTEELKRQIHQLEEEVFLYTSSAVMMSHARR